MPRHMPADRRTIGLADRRQVIDGAFRHHGDAICEFEYLVEVFRYEEHRRAAVTLLHELREDLRERSDVEPETRIHVDVLISGNLLLGLDSASVALTAAAISAQLDAEDT